MQTLSDEFVSAANLWAYDFMNLQLTVCYKNITPANYLDTAASRNVGTGEQPVITQMSMRHSYLNDKIKVMVVQ